MVQLRNRIVAVLATCLAASVLAACGGGGGDHGDPPPALPSVPGLWTGTYTETGVGVTDHWMAVFPGAGAHVLVSQGGVPGTGGWTLSGETFVASYTIGASTKTASGTLTYDGLSGTWAVAPALGVPKGTFELAKTTAPGEGLWEVSSEDTSPWFYLVCFPGGTGFTVNVDFDQFYPATWSVAGPGQDAFAADLGAGGMELGGVISGGEMSGIGTLVGTTKTVPFTAKRL